MKKIVDDQMTKKPPPVPDGLEQRGDKWGIRVKLNPNHLDPAR